MLLGFVGLFVTHPPMRSPAITSFSTARGPMWPMLFVIVACGAISGFHSLIASGTTSKQLSNERYAKRVGYGAMIFEGVLAGLAVLCVCAGLYWTDNPKWNFKELMSSSPPNWLLAFGRGYGRITGSTVARFSGGGLDSGMILGSLIGIITIKTFIMTTLDSATRIGRYVSEELFGSALRIKLFRNRFVSTIPIIALAAYLALTNWGSIWPVFGAANQLVAALALLVVTVLLMKLGKPSKYTFYPTVFMLVTTIGALVYQIGWVFLPAQNWPLAGIGVVLIILAVVMAAEGISTVRKLPARPAAKTE
jgi:carbon starvation protein